MVNLIGTERGPFLFALTARAHLICIKGCVCELITVTVVLTASRIVHIIMHLLILSLQTEIAKRLNTIIAQVLPFLSQEVSNVDLLNRNETRSSLC